MLTACLDFSQSVQIFLRPNAVLPVIGQIGQRFGIRFRAADQIAVQFQALVDDLLFEQRVHDDCRYAGFFQLGGRFQLLSQRGG